MRAVSLRSFFSDRLLYGGVWSFLCRLSWRTVYLSFLFLFKFIQRSFGEGQCWLRLSDTSAGTTTTQKDHAVSSISMTLLR